MVTTQYVPNQDAGMISIAPGLDLWREVNVHAMDYKGYDIDVCVIADGHKLVAQEVRVTRRPDGPPVTSEALRTVAVAAFVRHSIQASSDPAWKPSSTRVAFGLMDVAHRDRMREAGPTTETLEWVARVYSCALAAGDKPAKAVQDAFEVPRYTAGRWVASARKRGFLGPAEPGKAG